MNSNETIHYDTIGFDNQKYEALQKDAILERSSHFSNGTLYLEIGGKFLYDPHAARVLAGFDPKVKLSIIQDLSIPFNVIFCINANDLSNNRLLSNVATSYYEETTLAMLQEYRTVLNSPISVSINLVSPQNSNSVTSYQEKLKQYGFKSYKRYAITDYPDSHKVLGPDGYKRDDYIPHTAPLVLVLGAASNSGKLSTCLGQMYQDTQKGFTSGYAKFELFPIWNIPLHHPINLAYEAATADIGDYNEIDHFHTEVYGKSAINYNRDIDAFPIVSTLANSIVSPENYITSYRSPTDMGINMAGYAITNDRLLWTTARAEIQRRKEWYEQLLQEGRGKSEWISRCNQLLLLADEYNKQTASSS